MSKRGVKRTAVELVSEKNVVPEKPVSKSSKGCLAKENTCLSSRQQDMKLKNKTVITQQMEKYLYLYLEDFVRNGDLIFNDMIKLKAKRIYKDLEKILPKCLGHPPEFNFTQDWLKDFKQKANINNTALISWIGSNNLLADGTDLSSFSCDNEAEESNLETEDGDSLINDPEKDPLAMDNDEEDNNHIVPDNNKGSKPIKTPNDQDSDRIFLLSLLPAMKALSRDQRVQFKMSVLNELNKIRYGITTSETKVSPRRPYKRKKPPQEDVYKQPEKEPPTYKKKPPARNTQKPKANAKQGKRATPKKATPADKKATPAGKPLVSTVVFSPEEPSTSTDDKSQIVLLPNSGESVAIPEGNGTNSAVIDVNPQDILKTVLLESKEIESVKIKEEPSEIEVDEIMFHEIKVEPIDYGDIS